MGHALVDVPDIPKVKSGKDSSRAARYLRDCHTARASQCWLKSSTGEAIIYPYGIVVLEPIAGGGASITWKKRPIRTSWPALQMGTRRLFGFSRDATRLELLGSRNASSKITLWLRRSSRRHYCASGSMRPAGVRPRRFRPGSFALSSICVSTRSDVRPSRPWSQPVTLQIPVPMRLGKLRRENWTNLLLPRSTRSPIDNGPQYCSPITKALATPKPRQFSALRSLLSKPCWHGRRGRCVRHWPAMRAEKGSL
jgi:hypothetical protein